MASHCCVYYLDSGNKPERKVKLQSIQPTMMSLMAAASLPPVPMHMIRILHARFEFL